MSTMSAPRHAIAEDLVELLLSVVVTAETDEQARESCERLVRLIDGWVVRTQDCSDEEPGCWSVTIAKMWPGDATSPSEVIRDFVRTLGDEVPEPRVAFDAPTAWTVLDDPELLDQLVSGAERILVEAWTESRTCSTAETAILWPTTDEPVV